jgi:hypothetical protein
MKKAPRRDRRVVGGFLGTPTTHGMAERDRERKTGLSSAVGVTSGNLGC